MIHRSRVGAWAQSRDSMFFAGNGSTSVIYDFSRSLLPRLRRRTIAALRSSVTRPAVSGRSQTALEPTTRLKIVEDFEELAHRHDPQGGRQSGTELIPLLENVLVVCDEVATSSFGSL